MLQPSNRQRDWWRISFNPQGYLVAWLLAITPCLAPPSAIAAERIRFNRDVRPILAEHCWRCHGFDVKARQAGLRLDVRTHAVEPADSGVRAIVPEKPEASELLVRVAATDESVRMPPPGAPRRLTPAEIQILRQWISEGAEYQRHWAFEPLEKPVVPKVADVTNPIDAFVAAEFPKHGLEFSPEAAPSALLRRVSFDLTGLPPTLPDQERAVSERGTPTADEEGGAATHPRQGFRGEQKLTSETYEQTVDRLLGSPHFGERMALDWLDAARYADTDGYFGDMPRQMWLWRDWVIQAFNRNLPFDQFTVEQLAGDLLPNRTVEQQIATGFNRNHMSNNETGIIDEEYRVEYVVDRVDTTMSTWLGLTIGCAQCHDHKYDPISQREYYQLFAFFNNVPETGLVSGQDPPPRISVPTPEQTRLLQERAAATAKATQAYEPLRLAAAAELSQHEADVERSLAPPSMLPAVLHHAFEQPADPAILHRGTTLQQAPGIRGQAAKFDATQHLECDLPEFQADKPWTLSFWMLPDSSLSCPVSKIEPEGDRRGLEVLWQKGRITVNLVHRWGADAIEVILREPAVSKQWHQVVVSYDGSRLAQGLKVYVDGVAAPLEVRRDSLTGTVANSEPLRIGRRDDGLGYYGLLDELRIISGVIPADEVAQGLRGERIRGILEIPVDKRSARDKELLLDDFIDHRSEEPTRVARQTLRTAQRSEQDLRAAIPLALVMDELSPPRPTYLLERGQYDKHGEVVQAGVPTALSPWPAGEARNRLGFARWLMARDNPLTARVAVNRLWRQCFGEGLVRNMTGFGTQGEPPTHPELLDYLAATFRDEGWNTKALLRLIVTSRTYRQRSQFLERDSELVDPENRWLARGPSFRLPMEMIRDQALAASGLLVPQLGGPSVKPYQPPGLWEEVSYNAEDTYEPDRGPGLWRRSLYTYVKRQAPPPALLLFDGPTREKCTLRRSRTNTPLQALLLLNDDTYVEAARQLAAATLAGKTDDSQRVRQMYRRILTREATADELPQLLALLARLRQRYSADTDAAAKLLAVGATPVEAADPVELAAWTVVAHTLFNLDEAMVRR